MDNKYILINGNEEFEKHFKKWNFFDFEKTLNGPILKNQGQIFLYEYFESGSFSNGGKIDKLFYPKISVFLNFLPCDQTVEIECCDFRRTWEVNKVNDQSIRYCDLSSTILSYPQWGNYLLIYGVWDRLPNWKELRKHYEETFWFKKTIEEKRNIKLNKIING